MNKSNSMTEKINLSHLIKLQNQKFPVAYSAICSILEESETSTEYLTACLGLAKAKQKKLGLLTKRNGRHPLTATIRELNRERHQYFLSLRGSVNNASRLPFSESREAAKVLDAWLYNYQAFINTYRIDDQTNLANQLTQDLNNYPKIAQAMETLNLTQVLASIGVITDSIKEAKEERSIDRDTQRRIALELRRDAYEVLKTLINALDLAIKLDDENSATYKGYWNRIVRMVDDYNAVSESRRTRKRNTAAKNEQPEEGEASGEMGDGAEGNEPTTDATPKTMKTGVRNRPRNAATMGSGVDMDLQKKEETNADWDATEVAMNGSGTINGADASSDNGNVAKADNAAKGDAEMDLAAGSGGNGLNDASQNSSAKAGGDATGHSDAFEQESDS